MPSITREETSVGLLVDNSAVMNGDERTIDAGSRIKKAVVGSEVLNRQVSMVPGILVERQSIFLVRYREIS